VTVTAAEAVQSASGSALAADAPQRIGVLEASRPVTPATPLPAAEQAVVDVFERLTYSVVNVVDITVAQLGLSRAGAQVRTRRSAPHPPAPAR
jgi:hypothetical protein